MKKTKYHDTAKLVMDATGAEAILLIVIGGNDGCGVVDMSRGKQKDYMPTLLRALADNREAKQ